MARLSPSGMIGDQRAKNRMLTRRIGQKPSVAANRVNAANAETARATMIGRRCPRRSAKWAMSGLKMTLMPRLAAMTMPISVGPKPLADNHTGQNGR